MNGIELSRKKKVGNIMQCAGGVIHVNIPGVSLHIEPETFLHLSELVKEARNTLVDIELHRLLKDTGA